MKVFMVKGVHNSGKTTLVAGIIRELVRRGYTVGSLKDIHADAFQMDQPGTDTCAHGEAGSEVVVARGLKETDVLINRKMKIEDILPFFHQDYLILEGDPGISCPNLVTGIFREDLTVRMDENTVGFSGIVANSFHEYLDKKIYQSEKQIKEITDLVERKAKTMEKTQEKKRELKLYFNDEEVSMVPFVEDIIRASVLGIVGELRGYEEGVKIRIEL